jgi:hypothetical protein
MQRASLIRLIAYSERGRNRHSRYNPHLSILPSFDISDARVIVIVVDIMRASVRRDWREKAIGDCRSVRAGLIEGFEIRIALAMGIPSRSSSY